MRGPRDELMGTPSSYSYKLPWYSETTDSVLFSNTDAFHSAVKAALNRTE